MNISFIELMEKTDPIMIGYAVDSIKKDNISNEAISQIQARVTGIPNKQSTHWMWVKSIPALVASICIIAFSVIMFLSFPKHYDITNHIPDDSATIDNASEFPDQTTKDINVGNEPPVWLDLVDTPYAIVRISEISDSTTILSQNGVAQKYVKVNGMVLFSYNAMRFNMVDSYLDGSNNFIDAPLSFDDIKEFYVTEKTIPILGEIETVLFSIVRMNMDGKFYFGPATNSLGVSEFLAIKDSRLQIEDKDFDTRSFYPLQMLNSALDDMNEYINRGGEITELLKSFPTKKAENGMTIEDFDQYCKAWINVREIYQAKLNSRIVSRN